MSCFPVSKGPLLGFLVVLVLVAATQCHAEEQVIEVVGVGECADCKELKVQTNHAFPGLLVTIDCKNQHGDFERWGVGKLNEDGKFKVSLPKEILKDGSLNHECYAQLHSASSAPCPAQNGINSMKIVPKNDADGKHITFEPAQKLTFSTQLCTSATFWPFHKPLPKLPKIDFWKHHHNKFPPFHKKPLPPMFPTPVPKTPEPPVTIPEPPVTIPEPPVTIPKTPEPPVTIPKTPEPPVTIPKTPEAPVHVPKKPDHPSKPKKPCPPEPKKKSKPGKPKKEEPKKKKPEKPKKEEPKKPMPPIVKKPPTVEPPVVKPPIVKPPVVKPPIVKPPVVKPPIVTPPIVKPPVVNPPIVTPPIVKPPIVTPPIIIPPIEKPPIKKLPCPPIFKKFPPKDFHHPKLPPFPTIPPKYLHHPKFPHFPLPPHIPHA